MRELVASMLSGPVLPGTIVLFVCAAYWLLLIAGAVDLDLFDFDLDTDLDVEPGGTGWGMATLKFLNVGDVPFMIWITIFSAAYVPACLFAESRLVRDDGFGSLAASVALASAVALVVTKALTQPLRGKFETIEPNRAETLVGRTCVVTTSEVTDRFGQARLEAEGAPLLLNVRGDGTLSKNDVAVIAGYDADRQVFLVTAPPVAPSEPVRREAV